MFLSRLVSHSKDLFNLCSNLLITSPTSLCKTNIILTNGQCCTLTSIFLAVYSTSLRLASATRKINLGPRRGVEHPHSHTLVTIDRNSRRWGFTRGILGRRLNIGSHLIKLNGCIVLCLGILTTHIRQHHRFLLATFTHRQGDKSQRQYHLLPNVLANLSSDLTGHQQRIEIQLF